MLVQLREDGLRLVRQHDHALLAGRLASAWTSPPVGPVPWSTVLATSLHDVVWIREDRLPRLNAVSGRPHDFTSLPTSRKNEMVEEGLRRLHDVSPELARLVGAHHRSLAEGPPTESDPELTRVRLFDTLSLQLCLTPPGAEQPPAWLRHPGDLAPDGFRLPALGWTGPETATLSPFPFPRPLDVSIPVRDLPPGPYGDQATLERAWRNAPERPWPIRLAPSG